MAARLSHPYAQQQGVRRLRTGRNPERGPGSGSPVVGLWTGAGLEIAIFRRDPRGTVLADMPASMPVRRSLFPLWSWSSPPSSRRPRGPIAPWWRAPIRWPSSMARRCRSTGPMEGCLPGYRPGAGKSRRSTVRGAGRRPSVASRFRASRHPHRPARHAGGGGFLEDELPTRIGVPVRHPGRPRSWTGRRLSWWRMRAASGWRWTGFFTGLASRPRRSGWVPCRGDPASRRRR